MDRDAWKEARRSGIGSSDAAAIAGLNPYRSSLSVYADKAFGVEEEENEPMVLGRALEPVIGQEFARRTGFQIRRRRAILRSASIPFAICNLDFEVREPDGALSILECKACSEWMADAWADGAIPDMYAIQVHHQLMVTGRDHGWIAVLLGGNRLQWQRIDADPDIAANLAAMEGAFWKRVQDRNPPPPDGSDSAEEALRALFPRGPEREEVVLPVEAEALVRQYAEAARAEKAAREEKALAKQRLQQQMGLGQVGVIGGQRVCTWTERGFRLTKEAM